MIESETITRPWDPDVISLPVSVINASIGSECCKKDCEAYRNIFCKPPRMF